MHGQSFASPSVTTDISKNYPTPLSGYFNIGLLHTCVTGREGHEPYAPCKLDNLVSKGYQYWALGHVHTKEILSNDPLIIFSGNTQGRNSRETGPKGCILVTVDDMGKPQNNFKQLDVVRWVTLDIDVSTAENGYDIISILEKDIEQAISKNYGMPLAIRLVITGETPAHDDLLSHIEKWTNEIRATAVTASSGYVWVEKIKFKITPPLSNTPMPTEGAMGELLSLIDEIRNAPEDFKDLVEELRPLESKLPSELKLGDGGFQPDNPDWLSDALDQVRPMLCKKLVGTGGV